MQACLKAWHQQLLSTVHVSLATLFFEVFYLVAGATGAPFPDALDFGLAALTWLVGMFAVFLSPCCCSCCTRLLRTVQAWFQSKHTAAVAPPLGLIVAAAVPSKFIRVLVAVTFALNVVSNRPKVIHGWLVVFGIWGNLVLRIGTHSVGLVWAPALCSVVCGAALLSWFGFVLADHLGAKGPDTEVQVCNISAQEEDVSASVVNHHDCNTAQHEPNTGQHEPNTGQHEPNTAQHEPNTAQHVPNTAQHEPNTAQHEPNTTNHDCNMLVAHQEDRDTTLHSKTEFEEMSAAQCNQPREVDSGDGPPQCCCSCCCPTGPDKQVAAAAACTCGVTAMWLGVCISADQIVILSSSFENERQEGSWLNLCAPVAAFVPLLCSSVGGVVGDQVLRWVMRVQAAVGVVAVPLFIYSDSVSLGSGAVVVASACSALLLLVTHVEGLSPSQFECYIRLTLLGTFVVYVMFASCWLSICSLEVVLWVGMTLQTVGLFALEFWSREAAAVRSVSKHSPALSEFNNSRPLYVCGISVVPCMLVMLSVLWYVLVDIPEDSDVLADSSGALKIVTWNVMRGYDGHTARQNFADVGAVLRDLKADVAALQETKAINPLTGGRAVMHNYQRTSGLKYSCGGRDSFGSLFDGTGILSRFPISSCDGWSLRNQVEPSNFPWPKMTLTRAQIALANGTTLVVLNAHPLLGSGGGERQTLLEDQLIFIVQKFREAPAPAVLLGDFNIAMPSTAVEVEVKNSNDCCQDTMRSIRDIGTDVLNPSNLDNFTYPITRPWSNSRIDLMFVKGLDVTASSVPDLLHSDHYLVAATLQQ